MFYMPTLIISMKCDHIKGSISRFREEKASPSHQNSVVIESSALALHLRSKAATGIESKRDYNLVKPQVRSDLCQAT